MDRLPGGCGGSVEGVGYGLEGEEKLSGRCT